MTEKEKSQTTHNLEADQFKSKLDAAGIIGMKRGVRVQARGGADAASRPLEEGEKRLHLLRHGQGFHNLLANLYHEMGRKWDAVSGEGAEQNPYCRPEVVDPPLTEIGREEARALRPRTRQLTPELVVVSPMTRATHTAVLAFSHLLQDDASATSTRVPFLAHEACHEIGGVHTCDLRRPVSELRREFPVVDYTATGVAEEDPTWNAAERESFASLAQRSYDLLLWLRARPERDIVVVSHFAWLFTLVSAVLESEDPALKTRFSTGELRSITVSFEDEATAEPEAKRTRTE